MSRKTTAFLFCILLLPYNLTAVTYKGCIYGQWVDNPVGCSSSCGPGIKLQHRTITYTNDPDDKPCNETLSKAKPCMGTNCPVEVHPVVVHSKPSFNTDQLKPVIAAGAVTAGAVGIGALIGETLLSMVPLFALGKRSLPDEKLLLDAFIQKLQEKRKLMK